MNSKEFPEEIQKFWQEQAYRIQQAHTMLSWEACEMIAWNKVVEHFDIKENDYAS